MCREFATSGVLKVPSSGGTLLKYINSALLHFAKIEFADSALSEDDKKMLLEIIKEQNGEILNSVKVFV